MVFVKKRPWSKRSGPLFLVPSGEGIPPVLPGVEKSFPMRLSEGKQILERKRLNEKEIGKE